MKNTLKKSLTLGICLVSTGLASAVIANVNSVYADEVYEPITVEETTSENQLVVPDPIEWGHEFVYSSQSYVPPYILNHPTTFNYHTTQLESGTKYYFNLPVMHTLGDLTSRQSIRLIVKTLFTLGYVTDKTSHSYIVITTEDYNNVMGTELVTKDGFVYLHNVGKSTTYSVEIAK